MTAYLHNNSGAFIGPRSPDQLRAVVSWTNTQRLACRCGWQNCMHSQGYANAKHELTQYILQTGDRRASDDNHIPPTPVQNVAANP